MLVTLEETELVKRVSVIMLVVVRGGHKFHTISDEMAVKTNEQTDKSQVVWGDKPM